MSAVIYLSGVAVLIGIYCTIRKIMATKPGGFLFKIGYNLYSKTRIGQYYYQRELTKARQKFENGHSVTKAAVFEGLTIHPISMSDDNYAYLVKEHESGTTVLVDPADPIAVQPVLDEYNATPSAVLTTHKHWDHSGGNSEWRKRYEGLLVYGGAMDSVPGVTNPVADGDSISAGPLTFQVKFTPGHTIGHVVYILDAEKYGAPTCLFSGDHLFISGCGRMFEGPPSTMLKSLDSLLSLPDNTLVWPGHEYALDNLQFAESVEPENEQILSKLQTVTEMRKTRQCTCPSTLGEEKQYNPFLRTNELLSVLGLEAESEDSVAKDKIRAKALALLRERKDKFKYKL